MAEEMTELERWMRRALAAEQRIESMEEMLGMEQSRASHLEQRLAEVERERDAMYRRKREWKSNYNRCSADLGAVRAERDTLRSEVASLKAAGVGLVNELDAARRRLAGVERELERWRHGVPVEGDYVCPDSLALADATRTVEAMRESVADAARLLSRCLRYAVSAACEYRADRDHSVANAIDKLVREVSEFIDEHGKEAP